MRTAGFGKPFALDYAAVLMLGQARGADERLLAEMMPAVERHVLAPHLDDIGEGDGDE